jgi:hypothetical protein
MFFLFLYVSFITTSESWVSEKRDKREREGDGLLDLIGRDMALVYRTREPHAPAPSTTGNA